MRLQDEDGSALITVIILILVATLSLSLFFQYNRILYKQVSNQGLRLQLFQNTKSIVYTILSMRQMSGTTSLWGTDTTTFHVSPWGLFYKVETTSRIKHLSYKRTFLIGKRPDNRFNNAIVLGDNRNPLILTGRTRIEGNVLVGPNGVRAGILKGKRFIGEKLVLGKIIRGMKQKLPIFNYQTSISDKIQPNAFEPIDSTIWLNHGTLTLEPAILPNIKYIIGPGNIKCNTRIVFENISLLNQIHIESDSSIIFGIGSVTEQILAQAPSFKFNGGSVHRGQFIAEKNIEAANVLFKFPSLIAVINPGNHSAKHYMDIGANAVVNGTVLYYSVAKDIGDPEKIVIDASARINGFVFSNQYTEAYGRIYGVLMTNSFFLYSSPTTYINWINGAQISRSAYNKDFCIPIGLNIGNGYSLIGEL